MELSRKHHARWNLTLPLAIAAAIITGCGGNESGPNGEGDSEQHGGRSASAEIPHHVDGGLTVSDDLAGGEGHPPDLTPQQLYSLGQKSVFSIQGRRPDDFTGFGTGFLVDASGGLGVTNAHVVQGLTAITGRFNSGERSSLHVIASDPCSDLAVVHFSAPLPDNAQSLVIGRSADVEPGDMVTVLGYPATLTNDPAAQKLLITSGLVNATKVEARPQGSPQFDDTIQHGATVNYGNSGGPLLDHHGRVVGINTLTNFGSQSSPAQGQFYSIAIDSAKSEIVDKLLKRESQNDMGWALDEYYPGYFSAFDMEIGRALDERLARAGIEGGLYVKGVTPGSGASKAGIKAGMLITSIQSTSTASIAEMCDIVESIVPGAVAEVEGMYMLSDTQDFTRRFHTEFTTPGQH